MDIEENDSTGATSENLQEIVVETGELLKWCLMKCELRMLICFCKFQIRSRLLLNVQWILTKPMQSVDPLETNSKTLMNCQVVVHYFRVLGFHLSLLCFFIHIYIVFFCVYSNEQKLMTPISATLLIFQQL